MKIESSAFQPNGSIPAEYTCDGADVSPDLSWSGAPQGTKSYALIVDDPDAPGGTFNHWVLFDVAGGTTKLAKGSAGNGQQGKNSFGKLQYNGPCPPPGAPHHYHFKLYALKDKLGLPAGTSKADLLRAMQGKVLAEAEVVGTYARKR